MKVVLIGSGGYIGSHLLDALHRRGIDSDGISSSKKGGIDPESGLLPLSFNFSKGVQCVVYLSQSPGYREVPEKSSHVLAVNTLSAVRAATLARKANAKRFIYISTGTVYADSFDPLNEISPCRTDNWYALSKLQAEQALALFRNDLDVILVRPFAVYGPKQENRLIPNLIESILKNQPINLSPKRGGPNDVEGLKISLCYIDDVINILIKLITHGEVPLLNLASDYSMSIRQIAEIIAKRLKKEPNFVISQQYRDTDLIADIDLLKKTEYSDFVSFESGLINILEDISGY